MAVYKKELKLKYVKEYTFGNSSITKIAQKLKIPKQTLARWVKLYKSFGSTALENKKAGVKQKPINENMESLVLDEWKKAKKSVYAMRKVIKKATKKNGHNVSERQIRRIYRKHKLQTRP